MSAGHCSPLPRTAAAAVRSVNLHGDAVLVVRLDVRHVTNGARAVLWRRSAHTLAFGRDVDLPVGRAGAAVTRWRRRRRLGRGDAAASGTNVPGRAIRIRAARLNSGGTRRTGAEVDARFTRI